MPSRRQSLHAGPAYRAMLLVLPVGVFRPDVVSVDGNRYVE